MAISDKPEIIFKDQSILAVNKPAGISVIHDSHHPQIPSLKEQLEAEFGQLWVVHRLDRDTSGIMLFARDKNIHRWLNNQFQAREVIKRYYLLACGAFSWHKIQVKSPLRVNGDRQHRTIIDFREGKPAQTDFEILQAFDHAIFFVLAIPHSGYTHQIRAHLSSLNGYILNDPLYRPHPYPHNSIDTYNISPCKSWFSQNLPIQRLALHASEITFRHPSYQDSISIHAPYPGDFSQSLDWLKTTGQE